MTIRGDELFGLTTIQKESFIKIIDYLRTNSEEGATSFPTIPQDMFFGFDLLESKSLTDTLKWEWEYTGQMGESTTPPAYLMNSGFLYGELKALSTKVGEGVGAPAWAAALPALRTFVTANYDQPNPHNQAVMASPPTVTALGGTAPAGLTNIYAISPATVDTSAIALEGGTLVGTSPQRIYAATIAPTGGNLGSNDGKNGTYWRARVVVNAAVVGFKLNRTTAAYRFIVDGQYVDLAGTLTSGGTGGSGPD